VLLVTGITGHSGKYFLQELIDNSEAVMREVGSIRVLVRSGSDTSQLDACDIPIDKCVGDISDEGFLRKAMQGVDTVLHIAGIRFSRVVIATAIASGVTRIILVHTTGVYSKYKSASREYEGIDSEVRSFADESQVNLTVLRPTMIYGSLRDRNVSTFIRLVDKLKVVPVVNHARYELQPVHAKDLGTAYYRVLMNPQLTTNKEYNLSGKNPIMLIDMLKIIEKQLSCKRRYLNVPFLLAYSGAWIIFVLTLSRVDYREKIQRLCETRVFSHEEASTDFGFAPIAYEEGIVAEVDEYRRQKAK